MLVVIAIIALLVAVLLPAMRSVQQHSKAVSCSSNIKHLTFGLLMYETQNGTLPYGFYDKCCDANNNPIEPPGGYPGYMQYDMLGWWWFNFIEGFYRKSDRSKRTVVRCPSKCLSDYMLKNNVLCGNYGVNRSVCKSSVDRQPYREEFVGMSLNTSEITKPDMALLIVDSGYSMISWWNVTEEPPVVLDSDPIEDTAYIPGLKINKDKDLLPGQEQDVIEGRHPNKTVNIGFTDGHVRRKKADYLLVEKMEDGSYKNQSPLWLPE